MKSTRESLWAVAPSDRPREKLERLGPGGLTDSELVALVLGSGLPGINVLDNAASLLEQAGGVQELMVMTVRELKALMGVGVATAGRVVAVSELWRRAHDPLPGARIGQPHDIVEIVRAFVAARSPASPGDTARVAAGGGAGSAGSAGPAGPPGGGDGAAGAPGDGVGSAGSPGDGVVSAGALSDGDGDGAAGPPGPPGKATVSAGGTSYVVVADDEMRVLVVVPLARSDGESIPSLVPRILHEVLYRGGAAFALAVLEPESLPTPTDEAERRAIRDVLKLASSTVGLRYLSTVVMTPTTWSTVD
jgi:DNA repair protein RadC